MPAKKPARKRATAKVSPVAGMAVDAWMAKKLTPAQAKLARALRAVVEKHAPDATCAIKWGQPIFELHGPMAYIKAAAAHVSFGFWRGAMLDDPRGVLEGGARMKHWKFPLGSAVDAAALGPMVRQAAELNRALGNPAAR